MPLRALIWVAVSTSTQADEDRASLPAQKADALAYAEKNSWQVIDILEVPGHSRRYIDIHECARAMRKEGIDAFDRLLQHWENADFDVLICRDGSRFARTQSLHAYVVEKTIIIGAFIYSLTDGKIDAQNYRMWISMGGYAAAGEVDNTMRRVKLGLDARVERGLNANGQIVSSHRLIRNPQTGKISHVELDDSKTQEWQDLAVLLLAGVPYHQLPPQMFERFGYGYRGLPHGKNHYYRILHTPSFWGHVARHYKYRQRGTWIWNDDEPVPTGIILKRAAHAPVYAGEQARAIKAELTRRAQIRGRRSTQATYRLSGLVYCEHCGYAMGYMIEKRLNREDYRILRCTSRFDKSYGTPCHENKAVRESAIIERLSNILERIQQHGLLALTGDNTDTTVDDAAALMRVTDEVGNIEEQIRRLVSKQATADEHVGYLYDEQIKALSGRLKALKEQQFNLQTRVAALAKDGQVQALGWLREYQIADLWKLPERELNQRLMQLFGGLRIFIRNRQLSGLHLPTRR